RKGLSNAPIIDVTPGTLTPVSGSTYHRAPPRVRVRIAIALLSDLSTYLMLRVPSAEVRGQRGGIPGRCRRGRVSAGVPYAEGGRPMRQDGMTVYRLIFINP